MPAVLWRPKREDAASILFLETGAHSKRAVEAILKLIYSTGVPVAWFESFELSPWMSYLPSFIHHVAREGSRLLLGAARGQLRTALNDVPLDSLQSLGAALHDIDRRPTVGDAFADEVFKELEWRKGSRRRRRA